MGSSVITLDVSKYSKDGPFNDPVLRCDACHTLLRRDIVQERGCCTKCGTRRVRNVMVFSDAERKQMEAWGIDPAFLALFGEVKDA